MILAITEPVTRDTAPDIVTRVGRMAANQRVVVDLTGIPAFDSDGATAIVGLQESFGGDRVTIVGFRQATARLMGSHQIDLTATEPSTADTADDDWTLRRLRAIAVIQLAPGATGSTRGLEEAVTSALDDVVSIVVIDLRGVRLESEGLDVIAFASSRAALGGQELLVVNVDDETAERLRTAGLSATTFVAPAPLPDR
jgi:anti-anti-sigma regulatory factor